MKKIIFFLLSIMIGAGLTLPAMAATSVKNTKTNSKVANIKPIFTGTVSGISGAKITVKDKKGKTYTVNLSKVKLEKISGQKKSVVKYQTIKKNDNISIYGKISGKTIIASSALLENKAVVNKKDGDKKINIAKASSTNPQFDKGEKPIFTASSSDKFTRNRPERPAGLFGKISSVSQQSFVISSISRQEDGNATSYTVNISSNTAYTKNRQESASRADLSEGVMVMIQGDVDQNTKTISAKKIDIMTDTGPRD